MKPSEQRRVFEGWLAQHSGLLFKVVRAYAFSSHDQDDLFQEIATQLWDSVPKYRGDSAISTWIYRVALYSAMAWSKKENWHRERNQANIAEPHLLMRSATPENPRLEWLYDQISQLEDVDRSLTLLMLDGFSYQEIGDILGISPNYVGVKINRIKQRLTERSELERSDGI